MPGTITNGRLKEVRDYFDNGDTHVGYRRLLDSAIETQDMTIFEETLAFCDWYDQYQGTGRPNAHQSIAAQSPATDPLPGTSNSNSSELNLRVTALLEKIAAAGSAPVPVSSQPVIQMERVNKKYHSGTFSLKDIDLSLFPRQIIGLVGENGNGKTTLLRLLYGELRPDNGSITYNINGLPAGASFYDTKTRLAFIPQRPNTWYGSLMANLQFTATHYGYKGRDNFLWTEMICARMGLRAFRTYNWSRISSGYKMRFELAKAIIKKPQVLLLDEPLANLDVLAQQVILEDLRFLAESEKMPIGIILSSQQLYEVEKVSQQVVFLKNGVPKYQHTRMPQRNTASGAQAGSTISHETSGEQVLQEQAVFELETTATREQLQQVFGTAGLQNISFNGGVYLLYFDGSMTTSAFITLLGQSRLPLRYLRDISTSSRRFFNA